jgi:hypothetical protein
MPGERHHLDTRPSGAAVQDAARDRPTASKSVGRAVPAEALEYLDAIRPHARRDLWQLFPDRDGGNRPAEQLLIPRGRAGGYLWTRNEQLLGVFVALSDFEVARRLIANVVKVHHLWVDLDGAPLPRSWRLKPHAVVNTSPGKHQAVWRVDGVPQNRATHNRLTVALAQVYCADEGAQGINRVLRVPGYNHAKREPYRVRLISAGDHRAWSLAEVRAAWPTVAAALHEPHRTRRSVGEAEVSNEDARERLERQAERAAKAPEGSRNTVLTSAAFVAGLLVAEGAVDEGTAVAVMRDAARAAGLPESEADGTVRRQVAAGMREGA